MWIACLFVYFNLSELTRLIFSFIEVLCSFNVRTRTGLIRGLLSLDLTKNCLILEWQLNVPTMIISFIMYLVIRHIVFNLNIIQLKYVYLQINYLFI